MPVILIRTPTASSIVNRLLTLRFESVGSNLAPTVSVSLHQLLTTQYFAKVVHEMEPQRIRKKIERFRILVVGRANAGKTTLLQRVCNTTENPEVFDGAGNKVNTAFCAT